MKNFIFRIHIMRHNTPVRGFCFSLDGEDLYSSYMNRSVWNEKASTVQVILKLEPISSLQVPDGMWSE